MAKKLTRTSAKRQRIQNPPANQPEISTLTNHNGMIHGNFVDSFLLEVNVFIHLVIHAYKMRIQFRYQCLLTKVTNLAQFRTLLTLLAVNLYFGIYIDARLGEHRN